MNANASNGRSTASLGRGVFHVGKVLLRYYYPVEEWQIQVTLIRLCHLKQNAMGRITLYISIVSSGCHCLVCILAFSEVWQEESVWLFESWVVKSLIIRG